ncbi:MAG: hypothetical protein U1D30_06700 [Planctomycetota bacterium]
MLSNYDEFRNQHFRKWLGKRVHIEKVDVKAVTSYGEIFGVADGYLRKLREVNPPETELCLHLSPGTPTMTAAWVLLGKSRYPATFFETYKGNAFRVDIPFNLAVDFVPQFLKRRLTYSTPTGINAFIHQRF